MYVESLEQFYRLIESSINVKRSIVNAVFNLTPVNSDSISQLKNILLKLENIKQKNDYFILKLPDNSPISVDLTYEIGELKKDIVFLEKGEESLISSILATNDLKAEYEQGINFLAEFKIDNFVTDRDGTVNNYCGRYRSSVQSIYNSVLLSRFAKRTTNSIVLTSAPLDKIGLFDIKVDPEGIFIYAGSKGREYFDINNKRHTFPISKKKQDKLDQFNQALQDYLHDNLMFTYIGSGLQFKFGQTTIARQDINGSIKENDSLALLNAVQKIINKIDPSDKFFRIEDTGLDIEIILTKDELPGEILKDFNKADGVTFLDKELTLKLDHSNNLICGDTFSDVPMIEAAMSQNDSSRAIFVTNNKDLKSKVKSVCKNSFFVSCPDILILILHHYSKKI